jgi:solute carrier family 25 protein 38
MTSLTQLRAVMARTPYFTLTRKDTVTQAGHSSVLPKLSMQGNLIAGAAARVTVGFLLNPVTVLKARFEVRIF